VAEQFIIENYLGISCLRHSVKNNETFYTIARQYFVRPSTLALVNNVKDVEYLDQAMLYVPLTETNFYQTKGNLGTIYDFAPVYYIVQNETNFNEVSEQFFVSATKVKQWNQNVAEVSKDEKLIVGWLKSQKNLALAKAPAFIRKEKILFGNSEEKLEAKKAASKKDLATTAPNFADYSLPKNTMPSGDKELPRKENLLSGANGSFKKQEDQNLDKLSRIEKETATSRMEEIVNRDIANSAEVKRVYKSEEKASETQLVKITEAEKEFLQKDKVKDTKAPRAKSSGELWKKVRKLTQNSYVRKKEKAKLEKRQTPAVAQPSKSPIRLPKKKTMPVVRRVVKVEKEESTKPKLLVLEAKEVANEENLNSTSTVIDKTYKVEVEEVEAREEPNKPVYVENKLMRLTLLKSMKGRIAFFYSGTAGAKFYVFTNLAAKGGIIKLTNLTNKKYILAQVIGPLPEVDRKRGYIVKLSDNSRRIIGVKSKSFTAKVNY
jgi:hypothetical protein